MRFLKSAIAIAALGYAATTALAADVPDYIGGAEVPSSASRGMLERLGFTDLDATPEQKGNLLYTTGKWEGRDVELEVNLNSGVIRVLKEGPPPVAADPATDCLSLTAELDFEQATSGDVLKKCLEQQSPAPETAAAQCLELSAGLNFAEAGSGKLLRECLLQKVGG